MKSQGTFEYVLLLGGIIIVVVLVVATIISSGQKATSETNEAIVRGLNKIESELNKVLQ